MLNNKPYVKFISFAILFLHSSLLYGQVSVEIDLRAVNIKGNVSKENNKEMVFKLKYTTEQAHFDVGSFDNDYIDFSQNDCLKDVIKDYGWHKYNYIRRMKSFENLSGQFQIYFRGHESDKDYDCNVGKNDGFVEYIRTPVYNFSDFSPGEWKLLHSDTYQHYGFTIWIRYTIPKPEIPALDIDSNEIICSDNSRNLYSDVLPNNTGLSFFWEYHIPADDKEIYNPEHDQCIKDCLAQPYDEKCFELCEKIYPQTILKQDWIKINNNAKAININPIELLGDRKKVTRVEFKVRAKSASSTSYWSEVSSYNFAPTGPTIDQSSITYQEACFDRSDGIINLPVINSVSSVKYILKDENATVPCNPELSNPDCFNNESLGDLSADRKIPDRSKGKYKLWLTNPGGDYGACYSIYDVEVPELDQLKLQAAVTKELTCNNSNDAIIEFGSSGGHAATIKYKIDYNSKKDEYTTPQKLDGQKPGVYAISVFDKCTTDDFGNPVLDDNNKIGLNIKNPTRVKIDKITPYEPTCLDPGNGKILVNAANSDTDKYIYQLRKNNDDLIDELKNQGTNYQYSQLKNGEYKIIALDNQRPTCPGDTLSFTLNPPIPIVLSETAIIPPGCPGENGTIGLVANGESLSFEYILKDENNKEIRRNKTGQFEVSPADYFVSVRYDIPGCKDVYNHPQKLSMPGIPAPQISLNASDASCYGQSDGSILAVINQNKNFSYDWQTYLNGGWVSLNRESSTQLTGLEAGEYRLKINDKDQGCSFISNTITIDQPDELLINNLQLIKSGCTASTTQVNMDIVGGDAPYRWYYSKENGSFVAFTSVDMLTPGTYQFKAIDDNNCEVNYGQEIVITEEAMNLSASVTPVCYKSENGSFTAKVTGGDAPYNYSIDNGATFQNEATFDQLAAGNYQLLVRDNRGCEADLNVEVPAKDDTPELNFLVATRQNALDTLVIKEISNPKPDSLHWQFDSRAIVIDDNPWEPMVQFTQEGDYPVSITAWFDQCEYTMEKILHIRPFDPHAYLEIPAYQRPIEIMTANPNPSNGIFNVTVKMLKKQPLMLTVTDVKGLERYRKLWQEVEILDTILDLSREVEGTYLLRAVTENDVRELKIILQK